MYKIKVHLLKLDIGSSKTWEWSYSVIMDFRLLTLNIGSGPFLYIRVDVWPGETRSNEPLNGSNSVM